MSPATEAAIRAAMEPLRIATEREIREADKAIINAIQAASELLSAIQDVPNFDDTIPGAEAALSGIEDVVGIVKTRLHEAWRHVTPLVDLLDEAALAAGPVAARSAA